MEQSDNINEWRQKILKRKKASSKIDVPSVWGLKYTVSFIEKYTGLQCMFTDDDGMKAFIESNWDAAKAEAKRHRDEIGKMITSGMINKKIAKRVSAWNDIIKKF